ncbi:hypothetical protein F4804DRAFT_327726 [Jackrogersella minutella]|nr:hypothetical protein F4804DRAFT_327726 [Jackrogersella minutella]
MMMVVCLVMMLMSLCMMMVMPLCMMVVPVVVPVVVSMVVSMVMSVVVSMVMSASGSAETAAHCVFALGDVFVLYARQGLAVEACAGRFYSRGMKLKRILRILRRGIRREERC